MFLTSKFDSDLNRALLNAVEHQYAQDTNNSKSSENAEKVMILLLSGADPNFKSGSGQTLLHIVSTEGNVDVARVLLDNGANPHFTSSDGSTPLHCATTSGHSKIVQLLLDYWADPKSRDTNGLTPLHHAAQKDSFTIAKLLLDSGAERDALDRNGYVASHYARGAAVVNLLLGRQVDYPEQDASEPIFRITINGNPLDKATKPSADASSSNYILVQSRARLTSTQQQDLINEGLTFHSYVSQNTYLCAYHGTDLSKLRDKDPLVYVDVYHTEFKVSSNLRGSVKGVDKNIEIYVIFHDDVDTKSDGLRLQGLLASSSRNNRNDIILYRSKAHLTSHSSHLPDIAAIDQVRYIEEVGKDKLSELRVPA
ncbi:ankyrin repeat-containing domain protein [Nemania sp. FL0031]|nr:ankyrin repeat-containing domain protein [Nemania sp. FL0031]